jgi:hypothetical protein
MPSPPTSQFDTKYIKLGPKGRWEKECIERGIIRLGFGTESIEVRDLCKDGRWQDLWKRFGESSGTPTAFVNQTRAFFEDKGSTTWVTFHNGFLWHGRTVGGEWKPHEDGDGTYRTLANGGWSNLDAKGQKLNIETLSGKLTKTAAYRQTICGFNDTEVLPYLLRRLSGQIDPNVESAVIARKTLVDSCHKLLTNLTWQDFELLVELIFLQSGLRRLSRVGGVQRTVDLTLENKVTDEKVWVQVKSDTDRSVFLDYCHRHRTEMSDYSTMYYVFHKGGVGDRTQVDDDVVVWGPEEVASRVVSVGLTDWLLDKAN